MTEPREPLEQMESTLDLSGSVYADQPTTPIDESGSTDPQDPRDPRDPQDPQDPRDPRDPADPADPAAQYPWQQRTSGFHAINVGQLVMGVAFLVIAALWLLVAVDVLNLDDDHWVFPLPWVSGGVAGLLAILYNARRSPRRP